MQARPQLGSALPAKALYEEPPHEEGVLLYFGIIDFLQVWQGTLHPTALVNLSSSSSRQSVSLAEPGCSCPDRQVPDLPAAAASQLQGVRRAPTRLRAGLQPAQAL